MRKRMFATGLAVMCGLVLTATGLWASAASEAEPAAAADREMVRDPATGQMILKPQYGGSIADAWVTDDGLHTDTWFGGGNRGPTNLVLEVMGMGDWGLDRNVYDFVASEVPQSAVRPHIAESFEISPDGLTFTFHIRKGVHWQDKAPMNGRELVADDIVFSFQRMKGLGDFAEAGPAPYGQIANLPIESITAPDKYTVVFNLTKLDFNTLQMIYSEASHGAMINPPEVIQEHGHIQDWRNLVGTGPYELTDWVQGSSLTYAKNPNYWGYDEKFPENRLPYLDEIKFLIIPDPSTRLTALRTGTLARLTNLTVDEGNSLQKTNPELLMAAATHNPWSFGFDVRKPPFDDIRVRTAMQLALDNETINDTLFAGLGDTTPYGMIGQARVGFYIPFEEWPQQLKDNYTYDPQRAKQLLAEAGYPDGFETTLEFSPENTFWSNLDYYQLAVAYWAEIGVDVEIDTMEVAVLRANINNHTHQGITQSMRGVVWSPLEAIRIVGHSDAIWNAAGLQDPVYDAMVEAAENAGSTEEMMELAAKADMYYSELQIATWGPTRPALIFWQPWLVGYNGEVSMGGGMHYVHLSRLWLDADLREEMTGTR